MGRSHTIFKIFVSGESITRSLLNIIIGLLLAIISFIVEVRAAIPASAYRVTYTLSLSHTHRHTQIYIYIWGRGERTGTGIVAVVGGVFVKKGRDKLIHWIACQNQIVHRSRGISVSLIRLMAKVDCGIGGDPTRLHGVAVQPEAVGEYSGTFSGRGGPGTAIRPHST